MKILLSSKANNFLFFYINLAIYAMTKRCTALLVLFSNACHFNVKGCQQDASHETQRKQHLFADMHIHARACVWMQIPIRTNLHAGFMQTQINTHAPRFLRLLPCFISFSGSRCLLVTFNLWSPNLLTHLSSSKWLPFIFCKSPNQSWKHNAIQTSHRFQPHSLSFGKWMEAAENSDVLSHHDGVSLNVSYDLYRRCRWLKASAGDSTNHVTHPQITFGFYICSASPLFHPLAASLADVLLIEVIS